MAERLNDREYFALRAAQERALGNCCEDNSAALAHFRMADEYDRRSAEAEDHARADI